MTSYPSIATKSVLNNSSAEQSLIGYETLGAQKLPQYFRDGMHSRWGLPSGTHVSFASSSYDENGACMSEAATSKPQVGSNTTLVYDRPWGTYREGMPKFRSTSGIHSNSVGP
jgi:hypothetical protein